MKTTQSTPFNVPVGYADWTVLPFATPRIGVGRYFLHITGTVDQSTTDSPQIMIKPTFGMPGAPMLSDSQLISHLRAGCSFDGSNTVQTTNPPIEVGTHNGVMPLRSYFEWIGEVTVSAEGYLSLAVGGDVEAGKPVVVSDAVIELLPA